MDYEEMTREQLIAELDSLRQQSEQKLRLIAETSSDLIFQADCNMIVTYVSPAIEQILGYTPEEVIGGAGSNYYPPEERSKVEGTLAALMDGKRVKGLELKLLNKEGQIVSLEANVAPLEKEGRIIGMQGIMRDITDRKQTEEKLWQMRGELKLAVREKTAQLREANALLQEEIARRVRAEKELHKQLTHHRGLIEAMNEGIGIYDQEGRVSYVNTKLAQMLGYSADEIVGQPLVDFVYPADRHRIRDQIRRRRYGAKQSFELTLPTKDGNPTHVLISPRPLFDDRGRFQGSFSVVTDINRQKKTEWTLQQARDEFQKLYNASLCLNAQLDRAELLEEIIRQFMILLQAKAGYFTRYDAQHNRLVLEAGLGAAENHIGDSVKAGEGLVGQVFEKRSPQTVSHYPSWSHGINIYQDLKWLGTALAVPLFNANRTFGVLVVTRPERSSQFDSHDIELAELFAAQAATALENAHLYKTQQEQYHQLQQSLERLIQVEKVAALGRLIASIAHEINNPIQSIQNCLYLIEEELESRQRQKKLALYMGLAHKETDRIAAIVQQMRNFYRFPTRSDQVAAKMDMEGFYQLDPQQLQQVDIHTVLESVLQLTRRQLETSRINVIREWRAASSRLWCSPDHMKQVFLNLVLNALDTMNEAGGTLRIYTESGSPGQVQIKFSDTGRGMSPEITRRLFEPLFTTKEDGSGFGLFTSHKIIEAHHGEIQVQSQENVGTTFTILLPLEQPR